MRNIVIVPFLYLLGFTVAACSADVIGDGQKSKWASLLFGDSKNVRKGHHHQEEDFVRMLERRRRTLLADTAYPQTKLTGDAKSGDAFGTNVAMSGEGGRGGCHLYEKNTNLFRNGFFFVPGKLSFVAKRILLRCERSSSCFKQLKPVALRP